jgi:hypothetical protein
MATIKFVKRNITSVLSQKKGEILFNPAIAHWKGDLFLCAYRVFIRYKDTSTRRKKTIIDPLHNPQHPWMGGPGSEFYWQSKSGYDETRIVLLQIKGGRPKLVRAYGTISGVDIRLFKIRDNIFAVTGNMWVQSEGVRVKGGECNSGCMLMTVRTLTITSKNKLQISHGLVLCPQISGRVEKNWSLWKDPSGELLMSYGVSPRHEVFHLHVEGDIIECPKITKTVGKNDFFKRFSLFYNHIIHASLSTPAFRMSSGNYIAFGHVKYRYKDISKIREDTNLYAFNELLKKKSKFFHPIYVYLMYIYEFSPEPPYTILRISNMFMPESKFSLVFATDLTFSPVDNKYILSYGDHDSECWLLAMSEKEIDQALQVQDDPADVEFLLI